MALYLKQLALGPMENFVYLVGDRDVKRCWIVDPAWDTAAARAVAQQDGMTIEGALITHGHFDHVNEVETLLAHRDMPLYVHPDEMAYLDRGAPRGLFLDIPKDQVKPVRAGDCLTLGETRLTFLHTPGHTPGSQCFLVNGALLAGDTLFLGACGRCDLPGSDPAQLFDSLSRVLGRLPGETVLYPGHNYSARGTHATLADEKANNRYLTAHSLDAFLRMVGY